MAKQELIAEWTALQTQSDRLEQQSLLIKLVAIVVTTTILVLQVKTYSLYLVPLIFWLQDAIWKTFQSRGEVRLLAIEQAIASPETAADFTAMQFNQDFHANRNGATGLIKEYFSHACRPTIAFPHALLMAMMVFNF